MRSAATWAAFSVPFESRPSYVKQKSRAKGRIGLLLLWWKQLQSALGSEEAQSCPAGSPRCLGSCSGRVLVVGAGLAGLVSAQTLQRAGCEVVVLEAHGHVGGRAAALQTGPFRGFDAGAQWVHGGEENLPIMALARFFNLTVEQVGGNTDFEGDHERHRLFLAHGPNEDVKAEAFRRYLEAKRQFDRRVSWVIAKQRRDLALRSAWQLILNRSFDPLFEWQLRVRSEQSWGISPEQVGTRLSEVAVYSTFYSDAAPGDAKLIGGFGSLVRELAKGLNVRINTTVTSISLEGAVSVRTANETYRGAAVVVAVPLPILQQKMHLQPPKSSDWNASLHRLQMGDIAKLFIKFAGGQSPEGNGTYLLSKLVSQTSRSLLYYCTWEAATSTTPPTVPVPPSTLICLLSGASFAEVLKLKQAGKQALRSRVVEELLQMYPELQPTAVEAVQLVSFSWDPSVLGSWTSGKVGSSSRDFSIFQQAIPGMAFAGEHTCRLMYGTAQAAIVSGARAAHEVLAGRLEGTIGSAWPFFDKELYSLCDELAHEGRREHCGLTCPTLWTPLPEVVPSLFQDWQGMPKKARRCWSRLGWRKLSRMRQARKPASGFKKWLLLSFPEKAAATCLGFSEETWNAASKEMTDIILCRSGSTHLQFWDCLTKRQQRDWQRLGIDRSTLNEELPSAVATTGWRQLTRLQRKAAIRIGYRPWLW
ncbi:PAO4 [Symbiodinium microadriaticum]|nr:PAO4 [Symbiodinium microadriaticum]